MSVLPSCISQDAGYGDVKQVVRERTGLDVRWRAMDGEGGKSADETRALLAQPLTEESAVRLALLNNRDLQAAFEELGVARARLVSAVALPNPELEGRIGFARGSRPDLMISVTESVSDLLWLPMRDGAARAELDAAKLTVAGRVLDFVYAVKVAFHEREAAERIALLTATTHEAAEASYEAAARLHEAGNIPDLDFMNQQALREETTTAAEEARLDQDRAAGRLALLLAVPLPGPVAIADVQGQSALPAKEVDVTRLDGRALARSLDVEIARRKSYAASRRASLARATGLLPDLRAGFEAERIESLPWALGPVAGLRFPLFYQGQGEVSLAEAEMRRGNETRAALLARVGVEAKLAGERLLAARTRVIRYEKDILPLRRHIVEETLLRYNAMSVGVFQLLQAKRDQLDAELRYARAVRDYFVVRSEVELFLAGRLPMSRADVTMQAPASGAPSHD